MSRGSPPVHARSSPSLAFSVFHLSFGSAPPLPRMFGHIAGQPRFRRLHQHYTTTTTSLHSALDAAGLPHTSRYSSAHRTQRNPSTRAPPSHTRRKQPVARNSHTRAHWQSQPPSDIKVGILPRFAFALRPRPLGEGVRRAVAISGAAALPTRGHRLVQQQRHLLPLRPPCDIHDTNIF